MNLPQEIVDIIPQHHGTKLITYFYEKAKMNQDPELGAVIGRATGTRVDLWLDPKTYAVLRSEASLEELRDDAEASRRNPTVEAACRPLLERASVERRAYYRSNGEPNLGLGIVKTWNSKWFEDQRYRQDAGLVQQPLGDRLRCGEAVRVSRVELFRPRLDDAAEEPAGPPSA